MSWKQTGHPPSANIAASGPVRIEGIDTVTGNRLPRQIGTYASQRSALAAAREFKAEVRSTERGTVSWLVRRYVAGKTDITPKAHEQYSWAIPHIESELGAIPLSRLDRDDVARWVGMLADGGKISRRSVQICRNVLRAHLPRRRCEPPVGCRVKLDVLCGLRRSEVLALRWDDVDADGRTLRIDESLVAVNRGSSLGNAESVRSRRLVPLSSEAVVALNRRRRDRPQSVCSQGPTERTTTSSSRRVRVATCCPASTTVRLHASSANSTFLG